MSITEAYHACRTLVRSMNMGEDIYRVLNQQLEQYRINVLNILKSSKAKQVEWLDLLATEWQLFENRLVSGHDLDFFSKLGLTSYVISENLTMHVIRR
jgi:hypothetical protein